MTDQLGPGFPDDLHDDALVERMRAVVAEADPVPEAVRQAARAALATRDLDAELIQLVLDSAVDEAPALVRSVTVDTDAPRQLTFESGRVSLELQVTQVRGVRSLRGLVSGAAGDVVVETSGIRRSARSLARLDPNGWFTLDDVPSGALRLHLLALDGTAVATSWVTL